MSVSTTLRKSRTYCALNEMRQRRSGILDRQLLVRFAELRTARRDFDLAFVDLELHRARSFVRQQRHALHRARQPLAIELDGLVVALRNDALVGRKLPVDHPRDQHAAADFEEQVVLAALELNVALALGEQLAELEQRLLRKDDADFLRRRQSRARTSTSARRCPSVATSVRLLRLQHELRAVQEIPRVFSGDRELRLRDHLLDRRSRQRRACRAADIRQRRKVFARQRLHPRVEPIGRDFHAVLVLFDSNVCLGQAP